MELNKTQKDVASVKAACKSFSKESTALCNLEFQVAAGEMVAVIGANGSGKTTLLHAISGAVKVDSGTVLTLGEPPYPPSQNLRRRLGYVSQHTALDPEMTGKETLRFFCALHSIRHAERENRIVKVSNQFGLQNGLSKRVCQLSGGFRQRLHLAASLVHSPTLILADEPTAALDPTSRKLVWGYFGQLTSKGAAVVVVSHDLIDVGRHCHRVVMLSNGKKLVDNSPDEIVSKHGRTMLEAECDVPPDGSQLISIPELESPEIHGNRIVALLSQQAVEPVLNSLGNIRSYRCEKPSLATAYLKLSGEPLDQPSGADHQARRVRRHDGDGWGRGSGQQT